MAVQLGLQSHFCSFCAILDTITQKGITDIWGNITTGRTFSIYYVTMSLFYLAQYPVHSRQSIRICYANKQNIKAKVTLAKKKMVNYLSG